MISCESREHPDGPCESEPPSVFGTNDVAHDVTCSKEAMLFTVCVDINLVKGFIFYVIGLIGLNCVKFMWLFSTQRWDF